MLSPEPRDLPLPPYDTRLPQRVSSSSPAAAPPSRLTRAGASRAWLSSARYTKACLSLRRARRADGAAVTGPVARFARQIAGHGYVAAAPSSYHDFAGPEPLAYDGPGTDRGNEWKVQKTLASYDADAKASVDLLLSLPTCTGRIGVTGSMRPPRDGSERGSRPDSHPSPLFCDAELTPLSQCV